MGDTSKIRAYANIVCRCGAKGPDPQKIPKWSRSRMVKSCIQNILSFYSYLRIKHYYVRAISPSRNHICNDMNSVASY